MSTSDLTMWSHSHTETNITMNMMEREWGVEAVYILAILQAVFIAVGSVGNLLVMISILLTRHKCDRSYIFLFNLSVIDFLTSVCVMPFALVTLLNGDFIFSHAACEFNGFSTEVLFIASIHNLMYMAVYRYLAITAQFRNVHLAKMFVMIAACWLWSFIVSGLSWRLLNHFIYKPYTTQCGPTYPEDLHGWLNVSIVAGTCFIIPLLVILCMYLALFRKAHQLFKRLKDPGYSSYSIEAHAEQKRISITFIIIVVAFIICWTPIFGYLLYASYIENKDDIPTLTNPIVYWFSYMNSAINPFIYGFRTPIFKRLKNKISGLCRGQNNENGFSTIGKPMLPSSNNSPMTLPRVPKEKPAVSDSSSTIHDKEAAHPAEAEALPVA